MPMSWTPENDRLLLLKLIETHGISVDSNKIVAAWPNTGPKPTARAITERFVRLRQLAGIKVSVTTASGGRAARGSKFTTPRKRKTKRDSDESDAGNYMTDDDSPTKKIAVKSGGSRGSGTRGRGGARGGRGGRGSAHDPIKLEDTFVDLPADPFDADNFENDAAEAAELRKSSEQDPFGGDEYETYNGFQGFTPINGNRNMTGFSMMDTTAFGNGFNSSHLPLGGLPNHSIVHQTVVAPSMELDNGGNKATPGRAKSVRKASAQASEGVSAFIRRQKSEDEANGEKSSDDDSQASEYHELDGDYV